MTLLHRLAQSPIIAAVRSEEAGELALASGAANLFVMDGTVDAVVRLAKAARSQSKGLFVHLDLVRGLSSTDKESLVLLRDWIGADGVVTPKAHLVKEAKRIGLYAILHLFVIDSRALSAGLSLAESLRPDAVEIMPGAIPKIIGAFADALPDIPVVASGLIDNAAEAAAALNAGATSLSVSSPSLWALTHQEL
ncbi:glycerol-3-phosphate responsive antiterminator [Cohnella rhizosphaerae]|uniref:Glycerol uptake operon antiterminator regulatory protein n=1 Tax=Cohnella rhizosphaerae TaxID=1457232 RepID=A0A9X4L5E9_9BACL|nr:glycerol-3-phosphate responsive antiterminator [Cohnella rhizosphaerae]MDG0813802.1 glycerol-3-phosphate responsive antiterminator [Cohnella rhizosphaerae]